MQTMFHVTDEANVDSILDSGLQPQRDGGKVFLMDDAEKAEEYGRLMPVVDNPVVLEVEVLEHKVTHDDEEPGEEFKDHAYFVRGDVPAHRINA